MPFQFVGAEYSSQVGRLQIPFQFASDKYMYVCVSGGRDRQDWC